MFYICVHFFSVVITPCGQICYPKVTLILPYSLSTYLLVTQKNIPHCILLGDFTTSVHEFVPFTKYLPYFIITGRLHTQKWYFRLFEIFYRINTPFFSCEILNFKFIEKNSNSMCIKIVQKQMNLEFLDLKKFCHIQRMLI